MKISYKIAFTSLLGNLIEYFGFTLFAIFAKEIGQSFFPELDSFAQVISVFIIFGTGFLSRPIGAVFFGHFGDKVGRKKSLSYTILGMSVVTLLIAILPGYQAIGIFAPIFLLVLRLAQGFFVGGEGPGAALFMLEHSKIANRGQAGGIIIASIVSGSFLAVLVGILMNKLEECYIRPFAFYNDDSIGLSTSGKKVSVFVAARPFGKYFAKQTGIRCKVSSWNRINSSILPVEAKASGNYLNSIIASMEAKRLGFDEAILLSQNGYVAEGPGENIFLVKDNALLTPDKGSDILLGITRDSLIKIAEGMGIEVRERQKTIPMGIISSNS